KWRSVQVSGINAALQPPTVAVKEMTLVEPLARVAIQTNRAINLFSVLRLGETNQAPQPAAPASPAPAAGGSLGQKLSGFLRQVLAGATNQSGSALPRITVDTLSLTNGRAQFFDRSVHPPVVVSMEQLSGNIKGLSSEVLRQADLDLKGVIDRAGQFEVAGKLNPLSKNSPTDLKLDLHAINLVLASPYAGRFLGYRLNAGTLDMH